LPTWARSAISAHGHSPHPTFEQQVAGDRENAFGFVAVAPDRFGHLAVSFRDAAHAAAMSALLIRVSFPWASPRNVETSP
jgi:hypothetical protein